MNIAFAILMISGIIFGWHDPENLIKALEQGATSAVNLSLGLIASMSLFLGFLKIGEKAGLLEIVARHLSPYLQRLFPDVPANHPAMGAITFNVSANFLGLGNAATPFGIKAMHELSSLNHLKNTASNPMVMFLVLNTANVTLLPSSVMALRLAAGSHDPAGVILTTFLATLIATGFAIFCVSLFSGRSPVILSPISWFKPLIFTSIILILLYFYGREFGPWLMPTLILLLLSFGLWKKIPIYAAFVEGAKEGIKIGLKILPYLIAILAVLSLWRASGIMNAVLTPIGQWTTPWGLPPEALSLAVLRSLSGSGSFGLLASLLKEVGPDTYTGYLLCTIQASSETTFYVLAIYCGSVGVTNFRHALLCGVLADIIGLIASVGVCLWLVG